MGKNTRAVSVLQVIALVMSAAYVVASLWCMIYAMICDCAEPGWCFCGMTAAWVVLLLPVPLVAFILFLVDVKRRKSKRRLAQALVLKRLAIILHLVCLAIFVWFIFAYGGLGVFLSIFDMYINFFESIFR